MTQFLIKDTLIPPYMAFPRFLLDMEQLSETAKILYVLLLDRARLSQKNEGWVDERGRAFIFFPIKDLAETMHKSEMSVKTALAVLEKTDLIFRKRQGPGLPNKIYVKVPPEYLVQTDRNLSLIQTETYPSDGQETVSVRERKVSGSNNEKNNNKIKKQGSKADRTAYGKYQNVFLKRSWHSFKRKYHYTGNISKSCLAIYVPAGSGIKTTLLRFTAGIRRITRLP